MIAAVIQARMGSKRLKGKVLKKIFNKPLLFYQIERLKKIRLVNNIIVATTKNKNDEQIIKFCNKYNIDYYRGDENNVLKRYIDCAKFYKISHIIRLTADCPFTETKLLEKMIKVHLKFNYDYTSNNITNFWPDGLDIEIVKLDTLLKINKLIKLNSDKEHVTTFIKNNLYLFKYKNIIPLKNLSNLRLTVDQREDFVFINEIFKNLYKIKKNFNLDDMIKLFKNKPKLLRFNSNIIRNEGLIKSIKND